MGGIGYIGFCANLVCNRQWKALASPSTKWEDELCESLRLLSMVEFDIAVLRRILDIDLKF